MSTMQPISSSDVEFYLQNKSLLYGSGHQQNHIITVNRHKDISATGLLNQGATCYLNSLIQSLYHIKEFNKIIFQVSSNESNKPIPLIIKELQRLFGYMMLTNKAAVSTSSLIHAFGWNKSQMFEQHDIHEFFSVLIDALGTAYEPLQQSMNQLFQGNMADILSCPTCNYNRKQDSIYLNMSVDIPDNLEEGSDINVPKFSNLIDLIKKELNPEVLDSDNMWECNNCNNKVQAVKKIEYIDVPKILLIHLKRFRFDPLTKRRRKLTSPVYFPEYFDSDDIFFSSDKNSSSNGLKYGKYRLTSIMLHSGTAMGGHYRAYIKPTPQSVWLDCNDAQISEISKDAEESLLFHNSHLDMNSKDEHDHAAVTINSKVPYNESFVTSKNSYFHDNVYMLIYKSVNYEEENKNDDLTNDPIPMDIKDEIMEDNKKFDLLMKVKEISAFLFDFEIYFCSTHNGVTINSSMISLEKNNMITIEKSYPLTTVYSHVLSEIYHAFVAKQLLDSSIYPISNCRLRKMNKLTGRLGETFSSLNNDSTLEELGFDNSNMNILILQYRLDSDVSFTEHHPHDMNITISLWKYHELNVENLNSNEHGESAVYDIVVPGRKNAIIKDLRDLTAQLLKSTLQNIILISFNEYQTLQISNDDQELLANGIYPGSTVIVDIIDQSAESKQNESYVSPIIAILEKKRKSASIYFNNPNTIIHQNECNTGSEAADDNNADSTHNNNKSDDYNLKIEISLDKTLLELKSEIAKILNILDLESFHLRRSSVAPQLKDESKSLSELSFIDQSIIHVQFGKGCKPGEHMLVFELDVNHKVVSNFANEAVPSTQSESTEATSNENKQTNNFVTLGTLSVSDKINILQLKKILFEKWTELLVSSTDTARALHQPLSPNHIRLRDLKTNKPSGPLRDDRILNRVLLGLLDGRKIVIQVLDQPEIIGADDLILSIRVASYEKKTLSPSYDMPIIRTKSTIDLYNSILTLFPFLKEDIIVNNDDNDRKPTNADEQTLESLSKIISIAKGFSTGPPITLKSALKLKWNDESFLADDTNGNSLDRPPLNLRDGSIIIVRNNADFSRAQEAVKIRKQQLLLEEKENDIATGNGLSAVKARARSARGSSRGSSRGGTGAAGTNRFYNSGTKEKSLKIDPGMKMFTDFGKNSALAVTPGPPVRLPTAVGDDNQPITTEGSPPKSSRVAAKEAVNNDLPPPV
eukprot:gene12144-16261_t